MREKASKDRFLEPEGKGKEKKKDRGEGNKDKKKSNGCTLSFYNKTEQKNLLDAKGSFGDNVIKNPARNKNIKVS